MSLLSRFKPQRDEAQEEILQGAHKMISRSQLLLEELTDTNGLVDVKARISAQASKARGKKKKNE